MCSSGGSTHVVDGGWMMTDPEALDRAKNAITAEERGDHVEAKRLWRIELGDEFPRRARSGVP